MTIAAEIRVDVPADRIWHALRDRDELRRWHGWDADSLDDEIEQIYFTEATEESAGDLRTLHLSGTDVEVAADGTVRFVMTAPPEDPRWEGWYGEIVEGWITFAQQLRFALERHPGEDRTALYLETPLTVDVAEAPGQRYATSGLTGEVWFRSALQLGLTVDAWGHGLLVVTPTSAVLTGYGTVPALP